MGRLIQASLAVACLTLAVCGNAFGRISTVMELGRDADRADTVVVGEVVKRSVGDYKVNDPATVHLRFHVKRVLKGSASPGSDIDIDYVEDYTDDLAAAMGISNQNLSGTVLAMLRKQGNSYTFSRYLDSTVSVSSEDRVGYRQTPDERLNLAQEMRNSLLSSSKDLVVIALDQAGVLSGGDIRAMVVPLIGSSDMDIRIAAMRACIAGGELSVLPEVMDFLLHEHNVSPRNSIRLTLLTEKLATAKVEARDITTLADGLASNEVALRSAVCRAFGKCQNRAVLPYLKVALDDTSAEVRCNAMRSMSRVLGDSTPIPLKYSSDPDAYVGCLNYWKSRSIE